MMVLKKMRERTFERGHIFRRQFLDDVTALQLLTILFTLTRGSGRCLQIMNAPKFYISTWNDLFDSHKLSLTRSEESEDQNNN